MKPDGRERGGVTLTVLAPILAAVIGGAAAVGAAFQIINLAPPNADPGPAASQLSNSEVEYGGR